MPGGLGVGMAVPTAGNSEGFLFWITCGINCSSDEAIIEKLLPEFSGNSTWSVRTLFISK